MANAIIFVACVTLILAGVESCVVPSLLYVPVPQTIPTGYEITRVNVADCDGVVSSNRNFAVLSNGSVAAITPVTVPSDGQVFYVQVQGSNGLQLRMDVFLILKPTFNRQPNGVLKRYKRRWSPPPFHILENEQGPRDIDRLVSDSEARHQVYYNLTGPGFDKHPVGVFKFDSLSGMLTLLKAVDREEYPQFILTARVFDRTTHMQTDLPLPITIHVDDVNDNAPQFQGSMQFTVLEQSKARTSLGKINTTDRDQEGTDHVKIRYSLLTGLDKFAINPETGDLTVVTNALDRETQDKYSVRVQIKDRDGKDSGLITTGTATIIVGDINDNPPTFTKSSFQGTVNENEFDKLILRIPVEDKDLKDSPNWKSKFVITKGNENNNFRMATDAKTNEGLLYVAKPLDYEKTKNVRLDIQARNEVDLTGTTDQWRSVPVDLTVTNADEGPEFTGPTIRFIVKENTPNGTTIGTYKAVDPETKSSDGIKYYKVTDPAAWVNVDRNTGELRVANTIDRESHFVKDGLYNITMRAIDASSKTGTGTVILQVEDVNDNIPIVPPSERVLCEKEGELGSVLVVAEDLDRSPFSAPFTFSMPADHDGKWSVTRFNDTAATLQQLKELPMKVHKVPVIIKDLQGNGKTQIVNVRICQCRNGACLTKPWSASLGPLGWLALLLPLLLLLLLVLLLIFFCKTRAENIQLEDTADSGGILIKSNTEAPGEEVDSSLIKVPISGPDIKGSVLNQDWQVKNSNTLGRQDVGLYKGGIVTTDMQEFYSGQYDSQYGTQQLNYDANFLSNWQTNGRYLHQKLSYFGGEEDGRYADDIVHHYGYEGVGSAAGSVGCCSDDGDNENLDFLNTLGPKFKPLAGICKKT
ncbi:desmocollin 2-like protein [Dunckerocampus dactyliophorus]|uniref:desmocollin 2-like protein n=1 Tax=Dunckerocampus dactyliophorus TaxID=161453 RepID=UPI002404BD69|nr:desmocollin 2-like protein [Dunckerocampus dactyliophorus]